MAKAEPHSDDLDVEAFRRLYPKDFLLHFLKNGVRPDQRALGRARSTSISLGSLVNVEGSALVKMGDTTMLAGIKLEATSCPVDAPDEGRLVVSFQMPPVCSPLVRPGRQSELESVITEQLGNVISSSSMVDLQEFSIASGKAAWMAYLDVYCLDSDGSLFDAALLASTAALAHLKIPDVAVSEDGKVFPAQKMLEESQNLKSVKGKQLKLGRVPSALTCALSSEYILADPTAEEESILGTTITVVTDFSGQMISFYKPGGDVLASTSIVQDCIALAKCRSLEVQKIFEAALKEDNEDAMEAD